MKPPPDVTVIIPTRDALAWLPAAIASVGDAASGPAVEIVVVDDGSTDGTDRWLAARAASDPRLKVLRGEERGPSAARNLALEAARAPLVAYLDADDRWYPGKLAYQCGLHARNGSITFSFTDYRHITPQGVDLGGCFAFWPRFRHRWGQLGGAFELGDDALAQIYAENVVGTSTVLARTDDVRAVGGFDATLPSAEDWDLWLKLAQRGPVGCLPAILTDYLMHRPGNQTSHREARLLSVRGIALRHADAARAQNPKAVSVCRAHTLTLAAEIAEARGRRTRGARLRLQALWKAPSARALRETAAALIHRQARLA